MAGFRHCSPSAGKQTDGRIPSGAGPGQPDAFIPPGGRPGGLSSNETVSEICREWGHEDERRPAGTVGFYRIVCITRSIKKFKESGLITTQGSYILINYEQYCRMEKMISEILAEDL